MLRTPVLCLTTLCAFFAFADDEEKKPAELPEDAAAKSTFDKNLKPIVAAILKCEQVVLHEGLPHQDLEPELLQQELRTKKTVELGGFPFYLEPIALKDADEAKLQALSVNLASFQVYNAKFCDFHPDWCIEFKDGDKTYQVQICLSCHEAMFIGPDSKVIVDLSEKGFESFAAILRPLRKNRPERKASE